MARHSRLRHYRQVLAEADAREPSVRARSDAELRASAGAEQSLAESVALVREAVRRALGQRMDDVQILGGLALHEGALVEMKTGEGKTLTITLPAYLAHRSGGPVHVMTANDYLAERDESWMRPVYRALGLTTGLVLLDPGGARPDIAQRRTAYAADVTYGTPAELAYDYLRDDFAWDPSELVQRGRGTAIVDEADLILLDSARTIPTIYGSSRSETLWWDKLTQLAGRLTPELHYTVDPDRSQVTLTEAGSERIEDLLGVADLNAPGSGDIPRILDRVLRAKELYRRDRDYLVEDGRIKVLNRATGRVSGATYFTGGAHQAIAAKEGLAVPPENIELAKIATHAHLRGYQRLAAVTGVVAEAEQDAYQQIYGLDTVRIPTRLPVVRVDRPAIVYRTGRSRLDGVVREADSRRTAGQPVLIGTASIAQAEEVAAALTAAGIPRLLLSAQNQAEEAQVISQAGRRGAVTVVTRMVGRGVDIPLGGEDPAEREEVLRVGGLCVLAMDLFESRRLELHMRGRAGRRGDPGESLLFLALTDESVRAPLGERHVRRMSVGSEDPVDSAMRLITFALERTLGRRTERQMLSLCTAVDYDSVFEGQRKEVHQHRRGFLAGTGVREWVRAAIDSAVAREVASAAEGADRARRLHGSLAELYPISLTPEALTALPIRDLVGALRADAHAAYDRREAELSRAVLIELERRVALSVLDRCWREQMSALDELETAATLYSLSGGDRTARYRQQAAELFTALRGQVERESVGYLFNLDVQIESLA
jgi:preprotein translocase subunit SecA